MPHEAMIDTLRRTPGVLHLKGRDSTDGQGVRAPPTNVLAAIRLEEVDQPPRELRRQGQPPAADGVMDDLWEITRDNKRQRVVTSWPTLPTKTEDIYTSWYRRVHYSISSKI